MTARELLAKDRELAIRLWSSFFPFTAEDLRRFREVLAWPSISMNEAIAWSEELIAEHKDRLDFHQLSLNSSVPWSSALLQRYADQWDWPSITVLGWIPWEAESLDRFQHWLDWHFLCLFEPSTVPWSIDLFLKFADRWDEDERGSAGCDEALAGESFLCQVFVLVLVLVPRPRGWRARGPPAD